MKRFMRKAASIVVVAALVLLAGVMQSFAAQDPQGEEAPAITADNTSESTYFILKAEESGYVDGISAIFCNGEKLEEISYKMGLNGQKYYLDKNHNAIYFDKFSGIPFRSGDIITIENSAYQTVNLKIAVAGTTVTVTPVAEDEEPEDEYELHVRLVGYFEAAIVNQEGYDSMSSASTNISQNKNSDVSVEAAVLLKGEEPEETDWKLLKDSGITIVPQKTKVNMATDMGMAGVYSVYESAVTLQGVPTKAGTYPISVTIVDDQGRTATSNELIFEVYTGEEYLEDRLTLDNCTQTQDGKYMYDMVPWAVKNFDRDDQKVTVPKDIKAWYGSHVSGTYGELGYAVPWGEDTAQTLVIPSGCNLTFVNMDILSSVRVVVEDGGKLVLRDSVIQGVVDVREGGIFSMNYDDYAGEFLSGASINGQVILRDGAILENAKIYSNTNFIPNGTEARKNSDPVVVAEGNVTARGQIFILGDESPGGSYPGQTGLMVKDGTLTITEGSVLAVYGGGHLASTSVGGAGVILDNGEIAGGGKLIALGGDGSFGNGGDAVKGSGRISAAEAYLEGGNTFFPKPGSVPGNALGGTVVLSGNTNWNLIDGKAVESGSGSPVRETYWSDITEIPDLSLYVVEKNAPGEEPDDEEEDEPNKGTESGNNTVSSETLSAKKTVKTVKAAKTGDESGQAAWYLLMAVSGGAALAVYTKRRKRNLK